MTNAAADRINYAYSKAGFLDTTAAGLAAFDQFEMEKLYGKARAEQMLSEQIASAVEQARQIEQQKAAEQTIGGLSLVGRMEDDRSLPWHIEYTGPQGSGITRITEFQDFATAMENARMGGWNVQRVPISGEVLGVPFRDDGKFAIVRPAHTRYATELRAEAAELRKRATLKGATSKARIEQQAAEREAQAEAWMTPVVLGLCRKLRRVTQIEELEEVLASLTLTGQVKVESMGWLDGGERCCIQMKVGDTAYILGADPHDLYLTIFLYFKEDAAIKVMVSSVRVLCNNTTRHAERLAEGLLTISQKGDVPSKLKAGADQVLVAQGYLDEHAKMAEQLASITLRTTDVIQLTEAVLTDGRKGLSDREQANVDNKVGQITTAFYTSPSLSNLAYDGWRYYAALTEYFGPNGGDERYRNREQNTARSRLNSVWDPNGAANKAGRKVAQLLLNR